MNLKKFFCAALSAAIFFSINPVNAAQTDSATEKIVEIEKDAYGMEQAGAILNRINRLEKSFTGQNMRGNMNARIDAIYDILYENKGEPSVLAKINALEWNVNHEVSVGGIDSRLARLESAILGTTHEGDNFNSRIKSLSKESFGSDTIPMVSMQLPANKLIKVALTETIGSKNLQVGDKVNFKVAEDVIIDGRLVFAKGLKGEGTVKSVRKAKNWGRNGKVDIDFEKLKCIDGRDVEIFVGEEARKEMTDKTMIDGARLVGMDLSSDWDKALIHGKNVEVKDGTEFFVQTKNDCEVYGVQGGAGTLEIADNHDEYVSDDEEYTEE